MDAGEADIPTQGGDGDIWIGYSTIGGKAMKDSQVYSTLGITRQDDTGLTLFCGLRTKHKQEPDIYASLSIPVSHVQMQELVNKWFQELSPLQQQRAWASMKKSIGGQ
jgi:hypothetical protein